MNIKSTINCSRHCYWECKIDGRKYTSYAIKKEDAIEDCLFQHNQKVYQEDKML